MQLGSATAMVERHKKKWWQHCDGINCTISTHKPVQYLKFGQNHFISQL